MSFSPPVVVAASSAATSAPSSPSAASFFLQGLTGLGLGYAIAIALGVLVLLLAILLASYICCRPRFPSRNPNTSPNGVTLPRNIFVADDDGGEGEDIEGGDRGVAGLDPAAINSYPKFSYSKGGGGEGGGENVCSICLCEYKEGEMLRLMPDCCHYFHIMCIDAWLRLNASCPVCRNSPMPTPLSTPLSELVPLSHYSEDRRRRRR